MIFIWVIFNVFYDLRIIIWYLLFMSEQFYLSLNFLLIIISKVFMKILVYCSHNHHLMRQERDHSCSQLRWLEHIHMGYLEHHHHQSLNIQKLMLQLSRCENLSYHILSRGCMNQSIQLHRYLHQLRNVSSCIRILPIFHMMSQLNKQVILILVHMLYLGLLKLGVMKELECFDEILQEYQLHHLEYRQHHHH